MHIRNMEISFFGMPLYILDVCPENRDESNGDNIIKLWLQFIPIFGAMHSQLCKGHTAKKDISMFHAKKDISILFSIFSFSGGSLAYLEFNYGDAIVGPFLAS